MARPIKCRYSLITPPAIEPVTLAEAIAFLNLLTTTAEDDALITSLIIASRVEAEKYTSLAFITQTWQLLSDITPPSLQTINLLNRPVQVDISKPPLQSVTFVKTVNEDNTDNIIDASNYFVSTYDGDCPEKGRVTFKTDFVFPTNDTLRPSDAFIIEFIAGFGNLASDVPDGIKNGILQEVAFRFENRGDCNCEGASGLFSQGAIGALQPYRIYRLSSVCL